MIASTFDLRRYASRRFILFSSPVITAQPRRLLPSRLPDSRSGLSEVPPSESGRQPEMIAAAAREFSLSRVAVDAAGDA